MTNAWISFRSFQHPAALAQHEVVGGPRRRSAKLRDARSGLGRSLYTLRSPFGRRAGVGARARPVLRAPLRLRARSGPTRAKSTGADAFGAVGTRSAGSSIGTTGATDPPGMRVDGVATMPRSNGRSLSCDLPGDLPLWALTTVSESMSLRWSSS